MKLFEENDYTCEHISTVRLLGAFPPLIILCARFPHSVRLLVHILFVLVFRSGSKMLLSQI